MADNWKNRLADAFRSRGKGTVASSLDNSTREDPESTARVVSDSIDAQVQEILGNDPLMRSVRAHGIGSVDEMNAFAAHKAVGERILGDARAETHRLAVALYGREDGPTMAAHVDHQGYDQVVKTRDAFALAVDKKNGSDAKTPATRQTAPAGSTAVDVEAVVEARAWDGLPDSAKAQAKQMGIVSTEAQDAYAKNYMGVKS